MVCAPDCESRLKADLTVNGKAIELNEFVQDFMSRTVLGMLVSLRNVGDIDFVKLDISKSAKKAREQV